MKRDYIDFHEVPERQFAIHERLLNWARSLHGRRHTDAAPMFRQYQSPAAARREAEASIPADHADARRMAAAVTLLPERHRKGVQWHYVMRSSVLAGRKYVGCTAEELAALVVDARDMLRNRGV